jgi:hypothetical protein
VLGVPLVERRAYAVAFGLPLNEAKAMHPLL